MAVGSCSSLRMSILNQLYEDLKVIFLTEIKCKIRSIHAKEKKWGKKMSENFAIKGGGGEPLMENAILNFHFDFLNTSLRSLILVVLHFSTNKGCLCIEAQGIAKA